MTKQYLLAFLLCAFVLCPLLAFAQDNGEESESAGHTMEHEHYKNHMGGFLGASTHLDHNETGATLGLEYARMLSKKWAVASYIEMVSSSAERDLIFMITPVYYPWRGLSLAAGFGIERADTDVSEHDTVTTESEVALLLRFGFGYGWSVTPAVGIGPVFFADVTKERWTLVYGIAYTVGF